MAKTHLTLKVDTDNVEWRSTQSTGISWCPLHLAQSKGGRSADGEEGDATVLIRMEPGRGYPAHRHCGIEEVLVLAGGYRDELGTYGTGDYVRYESGSVHAPVALGDPSRASGEDNPACVLYAVARGGVALLD